MSRRQTIVLGLAALAGAGWASGCGDGATEPPPSDPPRPTTVTVTPATADLTALRETVQLRAEVRDQNGQPMAGASVSWASNATAVATVNASGLVTAADNGTATITATAGSASGSATVTVAQEVSAVAVMPAADTLVAGDTLRLAAEATDANGHAVAGAEFDWSSGDTLVAVVDDAGHVTGVGEGEAEVTATTAGVTGRAELTVVAPAPTAVAVTPDTVALTALGQTAQLAAEVRDQIGRVMEGVRVSWSSADTAVVAVDSAGLVTAIGGGATTVAASAGEVSGTAVVTVMQSADSVVVSPAADTVALGDTLRLAAEAFDENGHRVEGAEFGWSSSDVSVARVDGAGLVTGVAEGTAMITAAAGDASGTSEIVVDNPDRAVLVALYEATNGPNWVNNENWLTDAPLGEWYGVSVDTQGRVVGIHLLRNLLGGPISPALGRLEQLRWLNLAANALTGPIPRELGSLAKLTHLDLGSNDLTGQIPPQIGGLTALRELHLNSNNLTQAIPPGLGLLVDLIEVDLRWNQLTGPIPRELADLPKLEELYLSDNRLTGGIPAELGNMANLVWLVLDNNQLTGLIPAELGNITSLRSLGLSRNHLTGSIPPLLGDLVNLESLRLGSNQLTGLIPAELGNLVRMGQLAFRANQLTGPIPAALGSLANLRILYFDNNDLSGSIPVELGDLLNLKWLSFDNNRLTGTIPQSFTQLDSLYYLRFDHNDGLCVPDAEPLRSWLLGIERTYGPQCGEIDEKVLQALYDATGGTGWRNSEGWLGDAELEQWYGVEIDSIGRVARLDLESNGLSGSLPPQLGELGNLTSLRIGGNSLSGAIPVSLARTRLEEFSYRNTGLCVPDDAEFRDWLNTVTHHEGTQTECPPLSDRDFLVLLYRTTEGPRWTRSDNWLSEEPLENWHGVEVDGDGRVTSLDLSSNGLTGPVVPELGKLERLRHLRLSNNYLHGPIPAEWSGLEHIRTLDLAWNSLTGSIPPELGELTSLTELALNDNALRGVIPPELGKLTQLTELRLDCGASGFSGFIPSELGNLVRLTRLSVSGCWRLRGRIPSELGKLTELAVLDLSSNRLHGSIPIELGALSSVKVLDLSDNQLLGPVPRELGALSTLNVLSLSQNQLGGPLPRELGNLVALTRLHLSDNGLSGMVPPELSRLASLRVLGLGDNQFGGPIPPLLGILPRLETLNLAGNDLVGSIPSALGSLSGLRELFLSDNAGLSGVLPVELASLARMEIMWASGTDLCAPPDAGFLSWLAGLRAHRVRRCTEERAAAYLVQAVQSREFPVPLVADEPALLRVFITAGKTAQEEIPPIRATLFVGGAEVHVASTQGKPVPIPTRIDEGSLTQSANAEIPGRVVQPGLEMVIEVDPDQTLDPGLGVTRRIPDKGRLAVDVRIIPRLELTLIPFLWAPDPDSAIVGIVSDVAANPESHDLLYATRTKLPVGELAVTAHDPVQVSNPDFDLLLYQIRAIRVIEGGSGYWMGLYGEGSGGLATVGGAVAIAGWNSEVIAHELGHNMSLRHAPCAGAGNPDPLFPDLGGRTGAWGYDFERGELVSPFTPDLMGYCDPTWISDYHFSKAARYRLRVEERSAVSDARPVQSLLLWGGVDSDGGPFLEPAFVVDAPPALPRSRGEYEVTGLTATGGELFSLSFDMPEVADGDGSSGFAFALPVEPGWEGDVAAITLSGPGGSVTLDGTSNRPMAILRNPQTGQVRGILRDVTPVQASRDAVGQATEPRLEVLFSRGIPDAGSWRR